jgi:hypothetical protein
MSAFFEVTPSASSSSLTRLVREFLGLLLVGNPSLHGLEKLAA